MEASQVAAGLQFLCPKCTHFAADCFRLDQKKKKKVLTLDPLDMETFFSIQYTHFPDLVTTFREKIIKKEKLFSII